MRVGFFQYDVAHDRHLNLCHLKHALEQCQYELLVLPELSLCGYLFETRQQLSCFAENVPFGPSTQEIRSLSNRYGCTIIFGLAEKEGTRLFNTAVIVSKGRYIGKYRKIHLSDFEKRLFDRGKENPVFTVDGITIGIQICFDLWFPEISREQICQGADLLCVLANFGGDTTYHITKTRAIENLTPLILCNRVGAESMPEMDAEFLGKSTIITPSGQRVYTAPTNTEHVGVCEITVPSPKSNVICRDFESEIAFHYHVTHPPLL